MAYVRASARLQELLYRQDSVCTVMHPPSAVLARVMESAESEAGFVGARGIIGTYTCTEDVSISTMAVGMSAALVLAGTSPSNCVDRHVPVYAAAKYGNAQHMARV